MMRHGATTRTDVAYRMLVYWNEGWFCDTVEKGGRLQTTF
jgi:hypothetical protein